MQKSSQRSKTDWERVKRDAEADAPIPFTPADGPYDPNDNRGVENFFRGAAVRRPGQRGPQKSPTKEVISIRLSREVVGYFRSTGEGWQGRIDQVLSDWVKKRGKR